MSEEEVTAIIEKYVMSPKTKGFIPFLSKDADVIFAYCIAVKEVGAGCPDCVLRKRYGKGVKCPIVVTLRG